MVALWFTLGLVHASVVGLEEYHRLLFPELTCEAGLRPFAGTLQPFDPVLRARPVLSHRSLSVMPADARGYRTVRPDPSASALNRYAYLNALLGVRTRLGPIPALALHSGVRRTIELDDRRWPPSPTVVNEFLARLVLRHESDHAVRVRDYRAFGYAELLGSFEFGAQPPADATAPWTLYAEGFSLDELVVYAGDLHLAFVYLDLLWDDLSLDEREHFAEYVRETLDFIERFAAKILEAMSHETRKVEFHVQYDLGLPLCRPRPWFVAYLGEGPGAARYSRPVPPEIAYRIEATADADPELMDYISGDLSGTSRMARYALRQARSLGADFETAMTDRDSRRRRSLIDHTRELVPVLKTMTRPLIGRGRR